MKEEMKRIKQRDRNKWAHMPGVASTRSNRGTAPNYREKTYEKVKRKLTESPITSTSGRITRHSSAVAMTDDRLKPKQRARCR